MEPIDTHSNKAINQLLSDLEEIQHNLLMIKAAGLAYCQCFNDAAPISGCESPYNSNETAEYFVCRFLDLNPDAKLTQAMILIKDLRKSRQSFQSKTEDTTIEISLYL